MASDRSLSLVVLILALVSQANAQREISGTFKTEIVRNVEVGYALHIPDGRSKKPLIIFLHGSGERGTDIELTKIHVPFKYMKTHALDAYVLAPQSRENESWDNESLYRLLTKILSENKNIDQSRIYLTGLSLGGWGSWNLAMARPELFAALVPISSFVNLLDLDNACTLKDIPIKIYHGLQDSVVSVDYAAEIYKRLKTCNANVSLTIFDDADHDSWTRVYDNPEIYEWMLAQRKTNPQTK